MAIFRVEKTQDFTVMSNHHLRNESLTLKAKGLLSQILSLPPRWDFTLRGLSQINIENVDAIRTAIHELEREGYVTRSRVRKENGQLGGTEYIIHEQPPEVFTSNGATTQPISGLPALGEPILDYPTQVFPALENPTQLNTEEYKDLDLSNTEILNTDSIPFISPSMREKTSDG